MYVILHHSWLLPNPRIFFAFVSKWNDAKKYVLINCNKQCFKVLVYIEYKNMNDTFEFKQSAAAMVVVKWHAQKLLFYELKWD